MQSRNLWLVILTLVLALPVSRRALAQSAPAGSQASESAGRVELWTLVKEALERNPEIPAARRAIDAKRARIPQAKAWPDPKVSFSYAGNALPPLTLMRGDPSSARQIMAEQEIPYPGKTRLRGQMATKEADAETLAYEGVWRRVVAEVKQAYFDLGFVDQSLATLRKDRDLLRKFEQVAEARYSVGKAAQQDAIKAQVELSKLTERETVLEQTRQTLEAQLNSLRDLPVETPAPIATDLHASALPYSLQELESAAQSNFPALKQQRTMVEANGIAVDLARRELRPDFSLGYAYMQRTALPDMKGLTFSITLPVFHRNKQDQAIAEAAADLDASRRMEENELTTLRYRVKQEYLAVQAADTLMQLYSKGIVSQSSLALESSLAGYEVGTLDFLSVLSNFTSVLDYELAYHMQVAEHEKALARMEELTALDLIH